MKKKVQVGKDQEKFILANRMAPDLTTRSTAPGYTVCLCPISFNELMIILRLGTR